jgi:hypothetical protein
MGAWFNDLPDEIKDETIELSNCIIQALTNRTRFANL